MPKDPRFCKSPVHTTVKVSTLFYLGFFSVFMYLDFFFRDLKKKKKRNFFFPKKKKSLEFHNFSITDFENTFMNSWVCFCQSQKIIANKFCFIYK